MKMKKLLSLALAASMVTVMLTGCGSGNSGQNTAASSSAPAAASSAAPAAATSAAAAATSAEVAATSAPAADLPAGFNYTPVENTTGKSFKIAVLTVSNNPFWNNVVKGIDTAADYLKKDNVTVDKKEFNDFDGQAFSDAIDTCIAQKYDAICTVGVADTIVPSIDKATAAGIPVYTFNSDTAKQSTRVAFVGQDLYSAGSKLADTMAEIMGDQGKVGVITGSYKVNAHELRRQGFEDEMKNKHPNIKVVGDVENNDSGDEAYTAAKNFITANPDLTGIAVMAGGPQGAAKALSELKMSDKVTLVCFDTTEEIISYLKTGDIKATITQDPFGQGCDPIILAYNQLVTGQPQVTGNAFTKMDVYTPDNVDTIPQ